LETYSVLEHGYLIRAVDGVGDLRLEDLAIPLKNRLIPSDLWEELSDLVEDDETNSDGVLYAAADSPRGVRRLKVKNYIGVIATESGAIEVLPKLQQMNESPETALVLRNVVGHMLSYTSDIDYRVFSEAYQHLHTDLYEWFMSVFLQKVTYLVKRGLRRSYDSVEENLTVLKGRLLFPQHLRLNVADASKVYVRHDEFTANRPENRLIHSALDIVWKQSADSHNKRLARELLFAFSDVERSDSRVAQEKDFRAWKVERGAGHYRDLKGWCKAILNPYSPSPSADSSSDDKFESFLFPAEKLFEEYVANRLRHALSADPRFNVRTQVGREKSLFARNTGPFGHPSMLRPDIVIDFTDSGSTQRVILDAKWKVFEEKGQISSADLYQLYVYGKYWNASEVAIIAPATSGLLTVDGPYEYQDDSNPDHIVKIWVLPYDLLHENGGNFDCILPEVLSPIQRILRVNNAFFARG